MLAIAASRLSPSDTWKYKDDETKKRAMLESWRVRTESRESRETKACGETKERSGDWKFWKQDKAKKVDEIGVYGDCIPPEWRLQKMYKQLKIDNNKFTTWLVESVYPRSESLPSYITLSRKQAKGMSKPGLGRDIERRLNHVSRPLKIRHRCQQPHRACATNQESNAYHTGSPRPPHHRTDRILPLDVSEVHGPTLPILRRKPHILH